MRRPRFWIALALASAAAVAVGAHYFPDAFAIVALDITMDRAHALAEARAIAARDGLGPPRFTQAASFAGDDEAQTFVELEGGGTSAFTRMLRDRVYAAYTWRVRHFTAGETNETTIRFTPDGQPYGFTETLKEDAPGPALGAAAAQRVAESGAASRWHVPLDRFTLVEQGADRRQSGRVDHTFTYERSDVTFNEGRIRVRLTVAGDRLTGVDYFVKIPEAFTRRYASMRSANELIGVGSVVGMVVLYVLGGIGVGLFFMMRRRWVLWRTAAIWGTVVSALQALATINELPLAWMTYDTAIPRATFLAQQTALVVASFVGFSVFFALSFMAAETLSRRAFGHHPQLWHVWGRQQGASVQILGRTVGGYLLVSLFFAYDVVLYLVMTRVFHWWSPAEALVHPDVLATYAPWLSAIANSLQAGFWEESLFRAVPLAGAALIGDRFGMRRPFIVAGLVVEAIVFGAGHAPYPNQPAYARPVELIIPSIGFGLLYLYYGLVPGIILHFTFDVVWFALPIFMVKAPGIWVQQVMLVGMTLVPLWVVFWRRRQAGRWTELSPADDNAAWQPPPAAPTPADIVVIPAQRLSVAAQRVWMALGVAALVALTVTYLRGTANPYGPIATGRRQAESIARGELQRRGLTLSPKWRVLAQPEDGSGGPQQFVYETAGERRWIELLGVYLPRPRWRVRIATFEGDIADRAEEWHVMVAADGHVRSVQHTVPEGRAGVSRDEGTARQLALAAIVERYGLTRGQLKDVSAQPEKQKARTDWTFTFADTTIAPLPQGEPWIEVGISGDEVTSIGRFIHVPEEWTRQQRAATTRNTVIQIAIAVLSAGLLLGAAITGMILWSRRRYAVTLCVAATAIVLAASAMVLFNSWPSVVASLTTAAPLELQLVGVVAVGLVGVAMLAAMVGLAMGALPGRLKGLAHEPDAVAWRLGIAAGLTGAGAAAIAGAARSAPWARFPDVAPLGTFVPALAAALGPVTSYMTQLVVVTATLAAISGWTASWTRRRVAGSVAVLMLGFLAAGAPPGSHLAGWAVGGAITAASLLLAYVTLLRFDLTMAAVTLGVMWSVRLFARAMEEPYPGAMAGALLGALFVTALAAGWFRALRRAVAAEPAI